jgi:hypothetical protein
VQHFNIFVVTETNVVGVPARHVQTLSHVTLVKSACDIFVELTENVALDSVCTLGTNVPSEGSH